MPLTDYSASRINNHWLGGPDWPRIGTLYFAAFTTSPTPAGPGSGEVPSVGTGYARVAVVNNSTNFPSANSNNVKHLGNNVDFPAPTANWGTITHIGFFDAGSGGNLLFYAALTTPVSITASDTLQIPAGPSGLAIDAE